MAREDDGVLSTKARYKDGVLQAVARDEVGVLPIKACPLPSLVRRLEVDPDPSCRLTMRAADKWDSPRPTAGFFSGFEFFLPSSRVSSRPLAGNAGRWAAKAWFSALYLDIIHGSVMIDYIEYTHTMWSLF